jgi:phenylacetate-CoA ligase
MPFIRYDIGDRGSLSDTPCPCGRTLRTIRMTGRQMESIELEDGRTVALLDISAAIDAFAHSVHQFQMTQTSPRTFRIKVVPGPRYETNRDQLNAMLIRLLHPRVAIEWDVVDSIPEAKSGKAVYFVRAFETP